MEVRIHRFSDFVDCHPDTTSTIQRDNTVGRVREVNGDPSNIRSEDHIDHLLPTAEYLDRQSTHCALRKTWNDLAHWTRGLAGAKQVEVSKAADAGISACAIS